MSTEENALHMETNRRFWDEAVQVHYESEFYDVASFKAGRSALLPVERREVGDVTGKTLLHLQCHFGMDTLSWAREGATVTGADFSPPAIATARQLATDTGIAATFIESNLYDLPGALSAQFDVVFTSHGALCWLPDIEGWARVAASYVKPGGFFYIADGHPMAGALTDNSTAADMRIGYSSLPQPEPMHFEEDGTYADSSAHLENRETFEFAYSLGQVVTALVDAGLRIEFLHEFPFCAWRRLPEMTKDADGYWRLPPGGPEIPFLFSIKATKPA